MASLIPQSVTDTFNDLLNTYSQIETMKMQKRVVDAKISLESASLPHYMQDAQAKSQSIATPATMQLSGGLVLGLGLAAAVALYVIVK